MQIVRLANLLPVCKDLESAEAIYCDDLLNLQRVKSSKIKTAFLSATTPNKLLSKTTCWRAENLSFTYKTPLSII